MGIPKSYDDYEQMLAEQSLDIVICNSENSKHPEVVRACAAAGAHVCVEKPMASSLADAYAMVRAAESAKITALIHWYMPFCPCMRQAEKLIQEGAVGRILEVRTRVGHAGPLAPGARHPGPEIEAVPMPEEALASTWWYQRSAGGGAMIDFCSYGATFARWFIGEQAIAVMGLRANLNSRFSEVDDNGSMMIRFRDAMAICQGSWCTVDDGVCGGPVIYGTEATLVVDEDSGPQPEVRVCRGQGQVERYEGGPLPEGRRTVAEEFIHHLETGEPVHPALDMALNTEVTAIMDAGLRSAATGRLELVQSRTWEPSG
jgi:predicted dehydrogenase